MINYNNICIVVYIFCILILSSCKDKDIGYSCVECDVPVFVTIDLEPAWDNKGEWIAYQHSDSLISKTGIYLIKPDGTENHLWHKGFAAYPAWSPDGQWIAFEFASHIWKKKVNGDRLTQLTFEGSNFYPTWSPDGKHLAYDSNSLTKYYTITVMNQDGRAKTTTGYDSAAESARNPHWSATNKILHYISMGNISSEIFVMDANGDNRIRLTFNEARDDLAKSSPDGKKIVYISQSRQAGTDLLPAVWIMDSDGKNNKKLASSAYTANWHPNGNTIVYTNGSAGNGRLWLMNSDGTNKRQLTFKNLF